MDLVHTGPPALVLPLEDSSQIGHARRTCQQWAQRIGFDDADAGRAALVATELATNVLKHALRGALHMRAVRGRSAEGLEIIAVDRGPGFNFANCLVDGYSSRGTQGIGLGALSRQAQVFDLYADQRGAIVMARMYPRRCSQKDDFRFGVSHHALQGETSCGDTWSFVASEQRVSALVIDGLGHGVEAERAAQAGAQAFMEAPFDAPGILVERAHKRMCGTRGGAWAVAQFENSGLLRFSGIGNIGASLLGPDTSRGLASHPGIVGVQYRKAHVFAYPQAAGQLLVMHSDGVQTRWRLGDYPGLWQRHPAVIAALLHRDYCRGRDDATVLVIPLGVNRV